MVRLAAYATLAAIDVVAICCALAIASYARHGLLLTDESAAIAGVTLGVFAGVSLNSGAYSLTALDKCRVGVKRAVLALLFSICVAVLAAFFFKAGANYSRSVVALGGLLGMVLIAVGRVAFDRIAKRVYHWQPLEELVLVDGVSLPPGCNLPWLRTEAASIEPDPTQPFMLDRLGRVLADLDRVVVACPPDRRMAWALILKGANTDCFVLAPELDDLGLIDVERLGGLPLFRVSCGPLDLRNRALKRLLDVSCAFAALVFLLPVLLLTAAAIKLDSTGPVFFRQERVGRGNRLFQIFKFRSMRTDALDWDGQLSTQRADPRITRVGRLIRATSIDELPQILNVLIGHMSIVGPRPHALGSTAGNQLFWEVDPRYWDRHATKPGITGLAQVRGLRGATEQRSDLEARLQADLEYLAGWTLWRDVSILLRTMKVVIHKNAF